MFLYGPKRTNGKRYCGGMGDLRFFQVVGDETVYDIDRAIDLIEAYGARRVRKS